jgi:PIN domain nuclease of toxin-antitoxin system
VARLLLDTHTFLWWVNDAAELSEPARQAIATAENDCFLSVASCWEMAIKSSLGKLALTKPVGHFVFDQISENGFTLLNIEHRHAASVESLPFHHRDPFDRLLLGQAIADGLTLVSSNRLFSHYDVSLIR